MMEDACEGSDAVRQVLGALLQGTVLTAAQVKCVRHDGFDDVDDELRRPRTRRIQAHVVHDDLRLAVEGVEGAAHVRDDLDVGRVLLYELKRVRDLVDDRVKDQQVCWFEALQVLHSCLLAVCVGAERLEDLFNIFPDDREDGPREQLETDSAILANTQQLAFDSVAVVVLPLLHGLGNDGFSVADQDDSLDAAVRLYQLRLTVFGLDCRGGSRVCDS